MSEYYSTVHTMAQVSDYAILLWPSVLIMSQASQVRCLLLSHICKRRALAVTSPCANYGRNATMTSPHVQSTIMTNTISSPRAHLASLIFSSPNPHSRIISTPGGSPLNPYVNVPSARCRSHLTPVRSSSPSFFSLTSPLAPFLCARPCAALPVLS